MKKIPYNDFLKSMTMFFINDDVDEKFEKLRKDKVQLLKNEMKDIDTRSGLKKYITEHNDSLDNLLVILGVSNELFKRIISMFRLQFGMTFSTEWNTSQTRKYILSDELMMEKICDLFIGDHNIGSSRLTIPGYRLNDFIIDDTVMKRLKNDDFLDFLVRKDFDTQYNSDISLMNINKVEKNLNKACDTNGFKLQKCVVVDPIGNGTRDIQINYTVTKNGFALPSFYIKYSFNVTTSRGQTDFKRSIKDIRDYIRHNNEQAQQIIIVDGAGWVGRQSDLKDAWDYSDYCLNLKNLGLIQDIIK